MSKPLVGVDVAAAGAVVRVVLGAIVMGELDDSFAVCKVRAGEDSRRAVVGKEVDTEFIFREVDLFDKAKAEMAVEFD
jgi:hypothetical protein